MTPAIVFLPVYRTQPTRLLMLLRRTAADDRDAFTRLYDALLPQVTATVRDRLAHPDGGIQEVTAATFLEAWHCADQHTAKGTDVAEWINGIAARRAADPPPDSAPAGLTLNSLLHRIPRRRRD